MQVFNGSLVAIVTPMMDSGEVDYDSLKALVDWHYESGTNGVVSVGTTGESSTLNIKEHIDVIEKTVKYSQGRIPVIAGTGGNSTQEAIDLTIESKKLGADGALLVTPYYNKPTQEGLLRHYEAVANSVDIPRILYNVPSRTACDLLPATTRILSEHHNIVGIKEAVDDIDRIKDLVRLSKKVENFIVLSGDDPTFFQSMIHGSQGVISVAANIVPERISLICNNILNNNIDEAEILNDNLLSFYNLLFVESNPIPVKWMLAKMGKINNAIRLPLTQLNETYHKDILSKLKELGTIWIKI